MNLREAVERQSGCIAPSHVVTSDKAYQDWVQAHRVLEAAARSLLDAPEAWWCNVHNASGGPIWCLENEILKDGCNACRMVRVRIVPVPPSPVSAEGEGE